MYSTEIEGLVINLLNELKIDLSTMEIDVPIDVSKLGYQLMTKNGTWNNILHIIRKADSTAYSISYENDYFEMSGDHAILCKNIETLEELFLKVKDINSSQYQIYYRGNWIEPIIELLEFKIPIIDFNLDGDHTYDSNGFISHNTMFGDPYTTSGGKAIAFHSSVRIRLKQMGQIKLKVEGRDEVMGISTRAQVIKNRLGPPLRSVDYDIYFDSGIDDVGSWVKFMKDYGLLKQAGAWYTYTNTDTGEEVKFQSKDFKAKIQEDPALKENIYKEICERYILNYKSGEDFGIDDIVIDTDYEGEES